MLDVQHRGLTDLYAWSPYTSYIEQMSTVPTLLGRWEAETESLDTLVQLAWHTQQKSYHMTLPPKWWKVRADTLGHPLISHVQYTPETTKSRLGPSALHITEHLQCFTKLIGI